MSPQSSRSISSPRPMSYTPSSTNVVVADYSSPSPPTRPTPSGRKGSKKVRTGCITCKIRKVKCDEVKPFCLRCTKTGRKCDGYLDPRTIASRRRLKDSDGPSHHTLDPLLEFTSPEERRAFQFFQHVTAPCLSGDFDAVFWRILVLQICQTEAGVRHAVLAVSSLHEGLMQGTVAPFIDGGIRQSFALHQYNKAITFLLNQVNDALRKPLASLLTCVLFVCIEFMQGKDKESLIHMEQGRRILSQLDGRAPFNDPEMECIKRHIVPMYTRLSLTYFLFGASPVPIPESLKMQKEVPDVFESIEDLRHCMHEFMDRGFRFTQKARPAKISSASIPRELMQALEIEQARLLSQLAKLNVAFSLFRASAFKSRPHHTLLVLQMYLHAQHIWISTALSSSEVAYDDHLASFAAIVPLAAAYLDLEATTQSRQSLSPRASMLSVGSPPDHTRLGQRLPRDVSNFNFETHIIPPLYYVATKCRHPLIRHSALGLLRRNPARRENLWRASVMGAIAAHVAGLEERCSQGPPLSPPMTRLAPPTRATGIHGGELRRWSLAKAWGSHDECQDLGMEDVFHADAMTTCVPEDIRPSISVLGPIAELGVGGIPLSEYTKPPPIDPSLLVDVDAESSLSQAPSLTSSADEYSSSSVREPLRTSFAATPAVSDSLVWGQDQHPQTAQQPSPHLALLTTPAYHIAMAHDAPSMDLAPTTDRASSFSSSSNSGSTDGSPGPTGSDERFVSVSPLLNTVGVGGSNGTRDNNNNNGQPRYSPPPPPPHQGRRHPGGVGGLGGVTRGGGAPRGAVNTEAPFGLPEELRVHDAIIGPEGEDGSWVMVFRRLHGASAGWDVRTDWVRAA